MKEKRVRKGSLINRLKNFGGRTFSKFFGFERGIDITNDVMVLNRRNIVIKNIIFLSNLIYSGLFLAMSLFGGDNPANWLITALSLPITYAINQLLARLINIDPFDLTKQQVAMYVATFYIFLSSILVYIRMFTLNSDARIFETASYVLLYYALVVISLYQDKNLLKNTFSALLGVLTVIHFVATYDILYRQYSVEEFITEFLRTKEFGDILLRTVIFMLFYLVVFAIVSIAQLLHEERKIELVKRRQVQADFANIVRSMFNVVFISAYNYLDTAYSNQVFKIAHEIATVYNLDDESKLIITNEAKIHLRFKEIEDILLATETTDYETLKTKTELGQKIAKRIQILQKAQDIVRTHIEGYPKEDFVKLMLSIQPEITSQVLFLADLYVILRGVTQYKRPFPHKEVISLMEKEFAIYFDQLLIETFFRYDEKFEEIYNRPD